MIIDAKKGLHKVETFLITKIKFKLYETHELNMQCVSVALLDIMDVRVECLTDPYVSSSTVFAGKFNYLHFVDLCAFKLILAKACLIFYVSIVQYDRQ